MPRSARDDDLEMLEVIGRGGFSSVFKAHWRGKLVAVKVRCGQVWKVCGKMSGVCGQVKRLDSSVFKAHWRGELWR